MKIEKGLNLSQFIDYLENGLANESIKHNEEYGEIHFANCVSGYNDFLKQPLTKEMFVNGIERPERGFYPSDDLGDQEYLGHLRHWQGNEKKVIFKKYFTQDYLNHLGVKTIGDLFNHCNGKLDLKNIEI